MKIDIFANHIELNQPMRTFIEEKIGSLEKYTGNERTNARVEISLPSKHHRSGDIFYAEANLYLGGQLLRATAEHADMHTSITTVRDELYAQLTKQKEKKLDSKRKAKK